MAFTLKPPRVRTPCNIQTCHIHHPGETQTRVMAPLGKSMGQAVTRFEPLGPDRAGLPCF